ncbi:restriction endonuclease subunit S [Bacteroides ovatus]|nr:restriction endonuclease subunit S [Bacteroides ovatus]
MITGNTPPTNNAEYYNNGSYLWASPADLGTGKKINDTKTKLSESGFKKTRIIPKGSILVTCIGSTIGKMGMAVETMSSNQQINSIIVNEKSNNDFVYYAISRAFPRYLSEVGVQAVPILSKSNFEKLPNYTTSIEEQDKTGYFLNLLDERIATQNKIIEDLKKLKSAIIERHYNQTEKQTVFIADLGEPFNVGNLSKDDLSETGNPCIIYGELFTTYGETISQIESHTNKKEGMTLSKKGDLLFPTSTTVDAISLIAPSVINVDGVILGGDMFGIHISTNFNAQYLSYYFNHIAKRQLAKFAKGSTIIHLHYTDIEKARLLLPSLEEQNKMANCLISLDEKIRVEKSYLQLLDKQKAYLLRQMFI